MARALSAMKWRERLDVHGFHTIFIEYEEVNVLRWGKGLRGFHRTYSKNAGGQQSVTVVSLNV